MTVTINNATDSFLVALQKLVANYKGVEIAEKQKTHSTVPVASKLERLTGILKDSDIHSVQDIKEMRMREKYGV